MKFQDKYPNAQLLKPTIENVMRVDITDVCWNCGKPTNWVDIDFMAYLCSEECLIDKCDECCRAESVE